MTEDKFILDATAGFRMMWFNKHHPNAIYLDQRPECEPDIVGDFRDLKQFPEQRLLSAGSSTEESAATVRGNTK